MFRKPTDRYFIRFKVYTWWYFVISIFIQLPTSMNGQQFLTPKPCEPPPNEICEYWFYVKAELTMMYNRTFLKWVEEEQMFYPYNKDQPADFNIPIDKVISADGFPRMVLSINGTVPGPSIIVYEGQTIIVHVHNHLLSESITLHWHGIGQRGTPWMDGVGYISQCPIGAGQTWVYKFKAEPKGTHWYHSHMGAQRSEGLYGALIVKERPVKHVTYPEEHILMVGDWNHDSAEEIHLKSNYGRFSGDPSYSFTKSTDGSDIAPYPFDGAVINGRGRYYDHKKDKWSAAPLSKFNVTKGKSYRFRVINTGTDYAFKMSIDDHRITVIDTDGHDVDPVDADFIIMSPGERYDFILTANQTVENYWIRAKTLQIGISHENNRIEAILHYKASLHNQPKSQQRNCPLEGCKVVNCPFNYYKRTENTECITLNDLRNAERTDVLPTFEDGDDRNEYILNFGFPDAGDYQPGAINGKKFRFPAVDPLVQNVSQDVKCGDDSECADKICVCQHELVLPYNKTIQIVMTNVGDGAGSPHPIHMHGHQFYVMKVVFGKQNKTTGLLLDRYHHPDIDCGTGKYCNNPRWRNASWNNGRIPGLNLKNPPRKDTIIVPTGGYVVIRLRSDNPGLWFIHCHIEMHLLAGMAMVMVEAPRQLREMTKPPNFPSCENFVSVTGSPIVDGENEEVYWIKGKLAFKIVTGLVIFLVVYIWSCKYGKSKDKVLNDEKLVSLK